MSATMIGPDGIRCPSCGAIDHLVIIEVFPAPPDSPASYGGSGRWRCNACEAEIWDIEGELSVEEER